MTVELLEDRCVPTVFTVGTGAGYDFALPSQAAASSNVHDGDTIQIAASGNYNGDTCYWTQNNLTIQGVGGRAHIDDSGVRVAGQKAIWVIDGNNTTVSNIELSGAHDYQSSGQNWAGIRLEGSTLTLTNDYFHNNDDGILVNAGATSDITVTGCEFAFNGFGDGQSHNMYIGQVRTFTLQDSYSHDANVGHLVKSRALTNYILYNRIEDGAASNSTASYEIDLPQGGDSYLIGNLIEQGPNSQNSTIIAYGEEPPQNPGQQLYLVNNTIVNDRGSGTFINAPKATPQITLENNIFAGPGTLISTGGAVSQLTNLVTTGDPGFVNEAGYDYHLTAGSLAINAGTAPSADLTPQFEYLDPLSQTARPTVGAIDIGAYEYGVASNAAPTVATAASANPGTVTGTTTTVSVLGADDGGEANLTYTWSVASGPGSVAFSGNGTNAGKNSTATFTQAGSYVLLATITDQGGLSVTSTTQTVTVNQTLSGLAVTPATASVVNGATQQFTATATDQFGRSIGNPALTWASNLGTISSAGLYTAPASGTGLATITATSGGVSGSASVTITAVATGSSITVHLSEDAYLGNAQYTISVNGKQVGGVRTATASHSKGQSQAVVLTGPYAAGVHTVAVTFRNDKWGGTPQTDRNLYVDGIDFNGIHYAGKALFSNGTATFQVGTAVTAGSPITVRLSEDFYLGDAQYTISVDGQQVGGVRMATAQHGQGQTQAVVLDGLYAAGPHTVTITFLNDAYGGTAATDRNLYVDGIDFNGVQYAGATLFSNGAATFKIG